MSTPATLPQAQKILSLVTESDATRGQVQNLLANGDLLRSLLGAADLSKVDREAFRALLTPKPCEISWTPVARYADKLRDWNKRFKLDLSEAQTANLVLPDHAGPLQPTGISLTLGKGLKADRKVVQQIIKYELGKLGVAFTDYLDDAQFSYCPGSEPAKSKTPQLAPALLDIGRFWDPQNGIVLREVREQFRGRPLPALEVDWLMALNPQVLASIDYQTIPGFIGSGLVVHSARMPVFGRGSVRAYVRDSWDGYRWSDRSVVVFREVPES